MILTLTVRVNSVEMTAGTVSEADAQRMAGAYVTRAIGESFEVAEAKLKNDEWSFFIKRRGADLEIPAGYVRVSALTGEIVPLSDDKIWDIQAHTSVFAEHRRGHNPARGDDGLILPYQAKIKVNAYMGDYVAFFASSEEGPPTFIPGQPPFWRVATVLRLREHGKVAALGAVDVNAVSGNVVSLSADEIKTRQKKAQHAAQCAI